MTRRRIAAGWLVLLAVTLATIGAKDGADPGDPCTDFYAYANAAWLADNPIPEGQSRWSPRSIGRAANERRLQTLLEDAAARGDAPAGSAARLAGDFYAACMDEPRIDAAGVTPLDPLMAEIEAARTAADVARVLRRVHALAVPAGFVAAGAPAYRDPSRFVLTIAAGSFGARDGAEHDAYGKHVAALLALGGSAGADLAAGDVVALDGRLSEGALDPSAAGDPAQTDHPMTFAELVELAPAVDWPGYFDDARLPRTDVNVAEPRLLRQLDRELRETPAAVWRPYLRFQLLDAAAPYLSRGFVDDSPAKGKPRARHCAETTENLLGDEVGRLFVERYFPATDRVRIQALVGSLMTALEEDVAGVSWMTPETRRRALAKLAAYDAQVGAPHRWRDDGGLADSIRRDAFWASVAAARVAGVDADRRRVGKPTDRNVWQLPASSSSAYIDAQLNQIVVPAGFLLAIGYRPDMDGPELYGAIGAGIAHDLTHAIDAGGADFDSRGRPVRWWSDADRSAFRARAGCVDEEYAAFEVEPGLHLDGPRIESEAIGDLGGVRLAHRTLAKALEGRPRTETARDGLTAEQRFFVAWARSRAESVRPETERQLAKSDPHPPGRFRVNGTLANLPEFQQAFSCRSGARMVRPPEKRCTVW
jgi:endothelin-converting enzyme/putative endopeptidase